VGQVVTANPLLAKDAAARALHGRLVRRNFAVGRIQRPFYGRLHFRGATLRPYHFQITWQDNDYDVDLCKSMLARGTELLPADAALPAGVTIPAAAAAANPNRKGGLQLGGEPSLPAV
jgi:hypothetical protein